MSDLVRTSAAVLAERIATGEVSAREVAQAHLDRIEAVDDAIHAFLHVDAERALATADRVDARRAAGEPLGPLAGVPLAAVDRRHHAFNGEAGIAQEDRAAVFAVSGPVNPSTGIARTHLQQCPANP